jgi:OOP family OmpA-OmpF porin
MLAISVPAFSIELPQGATPTFAKESTAYSSAFRFNDLLEAYGLKMDPAAVASVPASYAKVAGDEIVFNNNSIAYTPAQYHSILTAYGIELKPEAVTEKLGGVSSYATVKNDEIVFGKDSIAYDGEDWTTILSAYSLPAVAAPVVATGCPDEDSDGICDDKDECPGTPLGTPVDERGCWVMSNELLFDFDKYVIKKEFYPMLDATKQIFDDNPTMRVQIEGHTDSIGTEEYNQGLSERRSNAVMKYLVTKVGIDANRLKAVGFGELKPAYPNDTPENRAKNRRVEFTPAM